MAALCAGNASDGQQKEGARRPSRKWVWATLVYVLAAAYILFFSWLSIVRHNTFQSNAMDLGYTDQVVWNTLHGRFFQFSTFRNAPVDLPVSQFRRPDVLLSYHAELLLAPISLLYLIYDSPVTLLVLQTVVLGLGALPAFWLARDHLDSGLAGLAFAAAYLLAPAVEGANLSDFHAVSMTASLLLYAFYFHRQRRPVLFVSLLVVAMSAKEDIPLLVVLLGLYLFLVRRERGLGAVTALLGLGWFLLVTEVIQPAYSGLPDSPFLPRILIFGPTIKDSLLNVLRDPGLVLRWLAQPERVTYLVGLLSSMGFTPLFAPLILAVSAPILAMNVFSAWNWTYSEGAHYSASIVPLLVLSGIHGLGFLASQFQRLPRVSRTQAVRGLSVWVLVVSGIHHYQIGISPLSKSYSLPRVTAHHRLGHELIARIPADAPISAGSGLYPHLAHREKAYFFPAINDAEYVLLDVTGSSYPITIGEVYSTVERLLSSEAFHVLAAQDGYLLLQREASGESPGMRLPDAFYTFARVEEGQIAHPLRARIGDAWTLEGYDYRVYNAVHAHQLSVTVATYWRVGRASDVEPVPALFFSRNDGALVYAYAGETPTTTWYPPSQWQEGELIRVETPALSVGRLRGVMASLLVPGGDPWSAMDRLGPVEPLGEPPVEVYEQGTLVHLFEFR